MSIYVSNNFKKDTQASDTKLVPLVRIGNVTGTASGYIFLSTGHFDFKNETGNPINVKPILLSIPSLKESIDLETRKYKISSATLQISNYEYSAKRFSDLIASNSMINQEVRIWWCTPSANVPYTFTQGAVDEALQVYFGKIRRYTHTSESVQLILEDKSQSTFHKDLPQNTMEGEGIPPKDKGKRIPMVYGDVERSPVLLGNNYKELVAESKEIVNFKEETTLDQQSYLFMKNGDSLINVEWTADRYSVYGDIDEYSQIGNSPANAKIYFKDRIFPDSELLGVDAEGVLKKAFLTCNDINAPVYSLKNRIHQPDENSDFFQLSEMPDNGGAANTDLTKLHSDGTGSNNIHWECNLGNYSSSTGGTHTVETLLLELIVDYNPSYDFKEGSLKLVNLYINGDNYRSAFTGQTLAHTSGHVNLTRHHHYLPIQTARVSPPLGADAISGVSNYYDSYLAIDSTTDTYPTWSDAKHLKTVFFDLVFFPKWDHPNDIEGNSDTYFDSIFVNTNTDTNITNTNNLILLYNDGEKLAIQFRSIDEFYSSPTGYDISRAFSFYGNLHQVYPVRTVQIEDIFKHKYFANVEGRIIEYEVDKIVDGDARRASAMQIWDIVRNELKYTDPEGNLIPWDEDSKYTGIYNYIRQTLAWKTDFTVDKKINSKKLIENIASVSPMIPRIDTTGNFTASYIKKVYDSTDLSGENSTILEQDVIDFSFSRTKIEDVATKIEFHYKWNYVNEVFDGKVTAENLPTGGSGNDISYDAYSRGYYGLTEDDSTLIIDDDKGKYIRDHETAQSFADWLLLFKCQQHLKMKVKLPLKYVNLSVGDYIAFDSVLGGVKPYGIGYNYNRMINGQVFYKYFMITSTNKGLDSIEIEAMQMHKLDTTFILNETVFDDTEDEIVGEAVIYGCKDEDAENYDASATVNWGCTYDESLFGCMDEDAGNYNSDAIFPEGCEYYGCMDEAALNYDENATHPDNSCTYPDVEPDPIYGCTDGDANNYDPSATDNDGSCEYDVYGCMDVNACNYYPEATIDDENCLYPEEGYNCAGECIAGEDCFGVCGGSAEIDECDVCGGGGKEFECWNGEYVCSEDDCDDVPIYGCMDPAALNYDCTEGSYPAPNYSSCGNNVTVDDGSCDYVTYGCMDEEALNYDPDANNEDNSCLYPEEVSLCLSPNLLNPDYNPDWNDEALNYPLQEDGEMYPIDENGNVLLDQFFYHQTDNPLSKYTLKEPQDHYTTSQNNLYWNQYYANQIYNYYYVYTLNLPVLVTDYCAFSGMPEAKQVEIWMRIEEGGLNEEFLLAEEDGLDPQSNTFNTEIEMQNIFDEHFGSDWFNILLEAYEQGAIFKVVFKNYVVEHSDQLDKLKIYSSTTDNSGNVDYNIEEYTPNDWENEASVSDFLINCVETVVVLEETLDNGTGYNHYNTWDWFKEVEAEGIEVIGWGKFIRHDITTYYPQSTVGHRAILKMDYYYNVNLPVPDYCPFKLGDVFNHNTPLDPDATNYLDNTHNEVANNSNMFIDFIAFMIGQLDEGSPEQNDGWNLAMQLWNLADGNSSYDHPSLQFETTAEENPQGSICACNLLGFLGVYVLPYNTDYNEFSYSSDYLPDFIDSLWLYDCVVDFDRDAGALVDAIINGHYEVFQVITKKEKTPTTL